MRIKTGSKKVVCNVGWTDQARAAALAARKSRVTVKKVDGEWQAVHYGPDGKKDEGKTYYTGGGGLDHKLDAEKTAIRMRQDIMKFRKGVVDAQMVTKLALAGAGIASVIKLSGKEANQPVKDSLNYANGR